MFSVKCSLPKCIAQQERIRYTFETSYKKPKVSKKKFKKVTKMYRHLDAPNVL